MASGINMVRSDRVAIVFGFSLCVLIAVGGILYVDAEESGILRETSGELSSLGHLKVHQIEQWRSERSADANYIFSSRDIAASVARLVSRRSDASALKHTTDWIGAMYSNHRYASIQVLTIDGDPLAVIPPDAPPPMLEREVMLSALDSSHPIFSDLQRSHHGSVRMNVYVPVRGARDNRVGAPVGLVVLEIDPFVELFDLISSWPVPQSTAEVILFRRDSDGVLYLNEFVNRKGTAVALRAPATAVERPAVWGMAGQSGVMEGVDYRGRNVLAYVAEVPNSPWQIVAKVDRDDLLSGLERTKGLVTLVVLLGMLFVAAVLAGIRQEVRRRLTDEQLRRERDLAAVRQNYSDLTKYANDIVLLSDEHDILIDVNDKAVAVYGYERNDMVGNSAAMLRSDTGRSTYPSTSKELQERSALMFETEHQTKLGRRLPVEISARRFEMEGRTYIQRIVRDISERRRFEEEITRLNRVHSVLSEINQLIVREPNTTRLLEETCRIAVDRGGFALVWLGRYDEGHSMVIPAAAAGGGVAYLDEIQATANGGATQTVHAELPVPSGGYVVCVDIATDPRMESRRAAALKYGLRSYAAFPLHVGETIWGTMSFYTSLPGFFTEKEVRLLGELATDISYALTMLRREQARVEAERSLERSEQRYRMLVENSGEAILFTRPDATILSVNPAGCRMFGRTEEEIISLGRKAIVDLSDTRVAAAIEERSRTGKFRGEMTLLRRDGTGFPAEVSSEVFSAPDGEQYTSMIIRDLTDQKKREEDLQRLADDLRRAQQFSRVGSWTWDISGGRLDWSEEMYRIFGIDPASFSANLHDIVQRSIHPDDRPTVEATIARVVSEGRMEPLEFRVVWSDRTVRHVWAEAGVLVADDQGRPATLSGYVQDITPRKLAEEALLAERIRMENIVKATKIGTWEWNVQSGETVFNDQWAAMLGYTHDELVPADVGTWESLTHPEDLKRAKDLLDAHFSGKTPLYECELRMRCKNGEWLWIHTQGRLLARTPDGKPLMMFGLHIDIGDRKESEEKARKQDELLKDMGRLSRVGGWEFDVETGEGAWTEEVARIHGMDPGDETTKQIGLSFYVGESKRQIEQAITRAIEHAMPYDVELELVARTGERRWVRTIGRPVVVAGTVASLRGSLQDITESKNTTLLLQEQLSELRRWNELSLDRESRVLELKSEVNALLRTSGLPPKYPSTEEME